MAVQRICSVEGCGKIGRARKLCSWHYKQLVVGQKTCVVAGCNDPVFGRQWCSAHYTRFLRTGDPLHKTRRKAAAGEPAQWLHDVVLKYEGDECIFWKYALYPAGYGWIQDGDYKGSVHNLVCRKIHGDPPTPKHQAAHSCGNGHLGCCTPRHVSWKTSKANNADKELHGTKIYGERVHNSKLTMASVLEIRALRGAMSIRSIAQKYSINPSTAERVINRKSWAWLE